MNATWKYIVPALTGFCIALFILGMRNDRASPTTISCCDCAQSAPITLSPKAARAIRRYWNGIGRPSSSPVRGVPIAVITIGNTSLMWMDDEIAQTDYPLTGMNTTWSFPIYQRLRSDCSTADRVTNLIAALETEAP